jgi:hypothetical protein
MAYFESKIGKLQMRVKSKGNFLKNGTTILVCNIPTNSNEMTQTFWIRHSWLEEHFHKFRAYFIEPCRGIAYQHEGSNPKKRVSTYCASIFFQFST